MEGLVLVIGLEGLFTFWGCGMGVICSGLRACLWAQSRFVAMVSFLVARRWVGPQALGLVIALAWCFDLWVGAWCLSLAWPSVALLGVFIGSGCGPFSLCRRDVLI